MEQQLEFEFVKPFNDAVEATEAAHNQKWNDLFRLIASLIPKKFDWESLFDAQPMMDEHIDESLCFPMTVIVGERNQLFFPFMREIYEKAWGFPVKFHCEVHP